VELMQLEMFVAVVEEGSVRRAAERVYRTQPAVSIAVRKLEDEFSAPLFDRSKRYQFRLTQAGDVLYRYAKRILSLRKEATSELDDISKLRIGRLRVGANESISLHLLPQLAQAYLKQHPGTRMDVTCERSESLLNDLKLRKLDLVLISFRPNDSDLHSAFILQDQLVLITGPTHALARRGRVQFKDLSGEPLLMMDVSQPSPWHTSVTDAFERSKVSCRLQVENAPIESIKRMIALGLGVGFVPLLSVREERERGELAVVEVEGFHEERSVWLVRRWGLQSLFAEAFARIAVGLGEEMQKCEDGRALQRVPMERPNKNSKVVMVKRQA
jgi:DNA-binding transcriptional LysR family regulator